MKLRKVLFIAAVGMMAGFGCGPKVMVPPDVDLSTYQTVGYIAFSSEKKGNFDDYLNERFLEEVTLSQRGARFLELGSEDEVLREIGHTRLDREAMREIGRKYQVDVVLAGKLNISKIEPEVEIFNLILLSDMEVRAKVDARITAKLYDTDAGALLWTASARDKRTVANLYVTDGLPVELNARNPENAYGELVDNIVHEVTRDLRIRYVRKSVVSR